MLRAVAEQQLLSWYCEGKRAIKDNKLNLFGKGIAIIDAVKMEPQLMQSILELDLSHNSIHQLDNIQQFTNLQSINLSHNLIADLIQVDKLASLKRLRNLYIKKNLFIKQKIPLNKLQFLLSMQTDVDLVAEDIEMKINQIVKQMAQISCYEDYRRKTLMHIELIKELKTEGSFVNPSISMFPKIKKIFQQFYEKQMPLRRVFVNGISKDYFQNEKKLDLWLDKEVERLKETKSTLIKEIYDTEDSLKQLRLNFNPKISQRLQEKKPANSEGLPDAGPKQLTSKMSTAISALRKSKGRSQNSPPKLGSEIKDAASEKYLQQNFVNILTKSNPLYHLLHSPLSSLKNYEKEMLIQQLLTSLKEKMKQALRYQSLEKEHASLKNDFISLQEHLEWITVEIKKDQENSLKKIKMLQCESEEQQNKISTLKQQLLQQKNLTKTLKQQNQCLKSSAMQSNDKHFRQENEELNYEAILIKRETRIKLHYLKMMMKKASHYAKMSLLRQINQKQSCIEWKQIVFEEFKISRHQGLCYKHLIKLLMRKNKKCLINMLKNNFKQQISNSQCLKYIRRKKGNSFLNNLRLYFQISSRLKHRIHVFRDKIDKRIKQNYFGIFRAFLNQIQQQSQNSSIEHSRDMIILRKHYKMWQRYLRKNTQRYNQGQALITCRKKAKALTVFKERCQTSIRYYIHCDALQTFLIRYRKINSYLQFTKSLGSVLLQREIKGMKIKKMKQYTYFQYFLSTVRDIKVKNKIRQHERQLKRQKEARESKQIRNQLASKKKLIIQNLKGKLNKLSSMVRMKIINRYKQTYFLHLQKLTRSSKILFARLRSHYNLSVKIRHKLALLQKTAIFFVPIRQLFYRLRLHKLQQSSAKAVQRQKTKSLTFYRWKSFIFYNRMEIYKVKFEEFESELGEVVGLQGKLKQEKQLLSGELLKKQMVIQEYIKKLQEYEYMIQSKDAKYQKLKAIYAEAIQLNDLNNTLKNHDNLILQERSKPRQDNFYMKYLPLEVQKKIGSYDNDRLQGNTQSNQCNGLADYEPLAEETFRRGGKINNGGSFVSTFRRF